jgi:hypothetical protein
MVIDSLISYGDLLQVGSLVDLGNLSSPGFKSSVTESFVGHGCLVCFDSLQCAGVLVSVDSLILACGYSQIRHAHVGWVSWKRWLTFCDRVSTLLSDALRIVGNLDVYGSLRKDGNL